MAKFVWSNETTPGRWVPEDEYYRTKSRDPGIQVIGEIDAFISPVSGKPVMNKAELREHNKRHDVVDHREFKGHKYEKQKLSSPSVDLARVYKEMTGRPV